MVALTSTMLVSIVTITFMARLDLIPSMGIGQISNTAIASTGSGEEIGHQIYNFTSGLLD